MLGAKRLRLCSCDRCSVMDARRAKACGLGRSRLPRRVVTLPMLDNLAGTKLRRTEVGDNKGAVGVGDDSALL